MIIVFILAFIAAVPLLVFAVDRMATNQTKNALERSEETFRELFDGRQTAVYEAGTARLPVDDVTDAADRYGYDVLSVVPGEHGIKTITMTLRPGPQVEPRPPAPREESEAGPSAGKGCLLVIGVLVGASLLITACVELFR